LMDAGRQGLGAPLLGVERELFQQRATRKSSHASGYSAGFQSQDAYCGNGHSRPLRSIEVELAVVYDS